jgi:hypothetical protein
MRTCSSRSHGYRILCLVGIVAVLLLLATAVPGPWHDHDDDGDSRCPACHLGRAAILLVVGALVFHPTFRRAFLVPSPAPISVRRVVGPIHIPRAPPA